MTAHDDMMRCRGRVLDALHDQMNHRNEFAGDEWIEAERAAVVAAANRFANGKGGRHTVDAATVESVEQFAVGHVDYASKLALYVAEIVVYGGRR